MSNPRPGWLALETGEIYEGRSIGAEGFSCGEVVFTTAMTGYVEVVTDPSFYGQIVVATYPHVGNHGVQPADFEWRRPALAGFVVGDATLEPSRADGRLTLGRWLRRSGIVGLSGLPTREITLALRSRGSLRGVAATRRVSAEALVSLARRGPRMAGRSLAEEVSVRRPTVWGGGDWTGSKRVAVIDYGVKRSLLEGLSRNGCCLKLFPAATPARRIMEEDPKGVVLSSGPGDPAAMAASSAEVEKFLSWGRSVLGVCLGHQLLGLAAGGRTYKLKFGHHGVNHPVRDESSGRVLITTQNHGFAVRPSSLPSDYVVTHVSLNDKTLEGFRHRRRKIAAYQFHPEGAPGPEEGRALLREFAQSL